MGDYADAGTTTLGDFLHRWLESVGTRVRPSTAASYSDMLQGHVVPRLGNVELDQLKPITLSSLYSDLLAGGRRSGTGGLSPRTVQYVHGVCPVHSPDRGAMESPGVESGVTRRHRHT